MFVWDNSSLKHRRKTVFFCDGFTVASCLKSSISLARTHARAHAFTALQFITVITTGTVSDCSSRQFSLREGHGQLPAATQPDVLQNLWLLEDGREKSHPFYSNRAHTHICEEAGRPGGVVPSSFSPFFNSSIEGRGAVWERAYSKGRTAACVHSLTHSRQGQKGRGPGVWINRRALSSSHRKKKAYCDP